MSTSSNIAILKADNTVESIYGNSDGYLGYNGICLFTYYQDLEKVKNLISLGNFACLKEEIYPKNSTHTFEFNLREPKISVFYERDANLQNHSFKKFNSINDFINTKKNPLEEFVYLYKEQNQQWYLFDFKNKQLILLVEQLKTVEEEKIYYQFKNDFSEALKNHIISQYKKLDEEIPILDNSKIQSYKPKI